ncbi:AAA family ATPase [Limosilactobacillus antri]|uniref:AAA family ATPase n=1 Tax=Limosilactobacillus antri TaxID=227943 RepID=UPI001F5ADDDA|nr:ATP-binding protein [Limosilactobacillus antri]
MKIINIELDNFRSIKHLSMSLKSSINRIKNVVAVYGENGAGKSTIIDSFKNLCLSIRTLDNLEDFIKIREQIIEQNKNSEFDPSIILEHSKSSMFTNILDVFKNSHTIDAGSKTIIKYSFSLDGKQGYYQLVFSKSNELLEEKMYHTITRNRGILFDLRKEKKPFLSSKIIKDKNLKEEIFNRVNRYWGQHTLLAIISNEMKNNNSQFIRKNIKSNILSFIESIARMSFYQHSVSSEMIVSSQKIQGLSIEKGRIPNSGRPHLKIIENILNTFIQSSYSDVLKVFYETAKSNKGIQYRLIFRKRVGGKVVDVPVQLESGGTRRLIRILPLLIDAIQGHIVVIDEIDNGIHDLLISQILKAISKSIKGQLIFTTHNTQLMNTMNSSNVYVLNINRNGDKEIYSLDEFGIRSTNNMAKMYLEGKFDGIPYPDKESMEIMMEELARYDEN